MASSVRPLGPMSKPSPFPIGIDADLDLAAVDLRRRRCLQAERTDQPLGELLGCGSHVFDGDRCVVCPLVLVHRPSLLGIATVGETRCRSLGRPPRVRGE